MYCENGQTRTDETADISYETADLTLMPGSNNCGFKLDKGQRSRSIRAYSQNEYHIDFVYSSSLPKK